jgi:hypothetical protein
MPNKQNKTKQKLAQKGCVKNPENNPFFSSDVLYGGV